MSDQSERPRNLVSIASTPNTPGPEDPIVRGAVYRNETPAFGSKELYIGIVVGNEEHYLVSLRDGNRWSDKSNKNVPSAFARVTPGSIINFEVGG